jgi:hypothetical protein
MVKVALRRWRSEGSAAIALQAIALDSFIRRTTMRRFAVQPSSSLRRVLSVAVLQRFALAAAGASVATPACSSAAAETVVVDPDTLRATIVGVSAEGLLCPEGSLGLAISDATATVIFSQSVAGVQTAGCALTFELDVPEGLSLGMPTTILRGVTLDRTRLERRYAFEGAGASNAFIDEPPGDFILVDHAELQSLSCGASRRVRYVVDVTAQVQADTAFFQLDSVDLDTSFRFGTDYRFCDPNRSLEVAPGASGEFCDGPQARPCAPGFRCDRERDPNAAEGSCIAE